MNCELCERDGGTVLWRDAECRIVRVDLADYAGYLRVILDRHVKEMTDLALPERERLMRAVFAAESALRELYKPDKINLACFGNQVPHVHWHVIARYVDDPNFPDAVWAAPRRCAPAPRPGVSVAALGTRLAALLT